MKLCNKISRNKTGRWPDHGRLVLAHATVSFFCWNVTNINCYCSAVLHYINICVNSHCEYMKCFDGQRGEFPHVLFSSLNEAAALYVLTELSHSCCSTSAWVLSSTFSLFIAGLLTKISLLQNSSSQEILPSQQYDTSTIPFEMSCWSGGFLYPTSFIRSINTLC